MYSTRALFKMFKKGYDNALKGHKIIYKNWDDVRGIRDTLRKRGSGGVSGIIITGSDYFIKNKEHSIIDESILRSRRSRRHRRYRLPILAICYGFQYMVSSRSSRSSRGSRGSIASSKNSFIKSNKAGYMKYNKSFSVSDSGGAAAPFNIPKTKYFFYHRDYIVKVPKDFTVIKKSKDKIVMAYNSKKNILGVQFHPEKYKKSARVFFNAWISGCVLRK
jgi:GMP synthase-like glutamine amidotransferase